MSIRPLITLSLHLNLAIEMILVRQGHATLDDHLFGSICKEICQSQWITTLSLFVKFEQDYMVLVSLMLVNLIKNLQ